MRQAYTNELLHYGILGMKWGVRRYQNADGSYTEAGKKRYATAVRDAANKLSKNLPVYASTKIRNAAVKKYSNSPYAKQKAQEIKPLQKEYSKLWKEADDLAQEIRVSMMNDDAWRDKYAKSKASQSPNPEEDYEYYFKANDLWGEENDAMIRAYAKDNPNFSNFNTAIAKVNAAETKYTDALAEAFSSSEVSSLINDSKARSQAEVIVSQSIYTLMKDID